MSAAEVSRLDQERRGALGHGRLMREWVALSARAAVDWPALVDEARTYVSRA
ncbi:MAG: hypothetical protein ACRDWI_04655 [Jiangellaceae bacterium]